jgi:hypothetical protein
MTPPSFGTSAAEARPAPQHAGGVPLRPDRAVRPGRHATCSVSSFPGAQRVPEVERRPE